MSDQYRKTVILPIPGIPPDCQPSLSPLLDAMKNNLETGIGERAKPPGLDYDQWVRIRDLTDQAFWRKIGSPINDLFTPVSGSDATPPGEPTDFTVVQGVWVNFLSWTNPTDEDFAYVEVWGGQTDDVAAADILTNISYPASSWAHPLYSEFEQDWYYWIRAVDLYGNQSAFVGSGTGDSGIEAPGADTIGQIIDSVMDALQGYQAEFAIYNAGTSYYYGDRVIYAGADGVDRTYKCVVGGGGSISGTAPLNALGELNSSYWLRSGILIEGDVDGVATVGIDGNAVIDGTLLARSIKTDELIVGDNIDISDGAITIDAIGDTAQSILASSAGALVQNPDFEAGDTGWYMANGWSIETGNELSGDYCAENDPSAMTGVAAGAENNQRSPVAEGERYLVQAWIKADSGYDGTGAIGVSWRGETLAWVGSSYIYSALWPTTWTFVRGVVTAPANAFFSSAYIRRYSSPTTGKLYVDNLKISAIPKDSDIDLLGITNGLAFSEAVTDLQAIADREIVTYVQSSEPSFGISYGDLWLDLYGTGWPSYNNIYRYENSSGGYTGTLAWRSAPSNPLGMAMIDIANSEEAITFAQDTADGKITTYYQSTVPTAEGSGDLWYNTSTFILYRAAVAGSNSINAGEWEPTVDKTSENTAKDTLYIPEGLDPTKRGFFANANALGFQSYGVATSYFSSNGDFIFRGDGSNYFSWAGSNLTLSTNGAFNLLGGGSFNVYSGGSIAIAGGGGLSIASGGSINVANGGDIIIANGGDIIMQTASGANSTIIFEAQTYDFWINADYSANMFGLYAVSDGHGKLNLGYSGRRFEEVEINTTGDISIASDNMTLNGSGDLGITGDLTCDSIYLENAGVIDADSSLRLDIGTQDFYFVPTQIRANTHKTVFLGGSAYAFDTVYADDFTNVADFLWMDNWQNKDMGNIVEPLDDVEIIKAIQPSGEYNKVSGLMMINDDTLHPALLLRDKKTKQPVYDPDGKPYLSLKTMISLLMGATRSLDSRIENLEKGKNKNV